MESWIPRAILGYIVFLVFVVTVTSASTNINVSVYDLTPEQEAALSDPSTDAPTLLNKFIILASVSTPHAILALITFVMSVLFILAVAAAVNEFVPFT